MAFGFNWLRGRKKTAKKDKFSEEDVQKTLDRVLPQSYKEAAGIGKKSIPGGPSRKSPEASIDELDARLSQFQQEFQNIGKSTEMMTKSLGKYEKELTHGLNQRGILRHNREDRTIQDVRMEKPDFDDDDDDNNIMRKKRQ